MPRKGSIGIKIIAVASLFAFVFLGAVVVILLTQARGHMLDASVQLLEEDVRAEKERIDFYLQQIPDTVQSLKGTPPLQGMIRAEDNQGFDVEENSTIAQWQSRLAAIFIAEMNATKLYAQMRYIDASGQEVIRVNFINGVAVRVEEGQLQNKGDREYFLEAIENERNITYLSRAELNREGSPPTISTPHTAIIRYAIPVYEDDSDRPPRGVIVANVLVEEVIASSDRLHSEEREKKHYIISDDGFFVSHVDSRKEWGGPKDLETGYSVQDEFSDLTLDKLFEDRFGTFITSEYIFAYAVLGLSGSENSNKWVVLQVTPVHAVLGPINSVTVYTAFFGVFVFIVLFFSFVFLVRNILKPLDLLRDAAVQVGEGSFDVEVPVKHNDEIGEVARVFNTMTSQLASQYGELEEKVKKKTKQLRKKVEELKKTQRAMMNVLDDMEHEKEQAQILAEDLEKFKLAVENSSDMILITDPHANVLYANHAVEKITGYTKEEILTAKCGSLWGGYMQKAFYKKMWDTIAKKKKPFEGRVENKRKNGQMFVGHTNIVPILDEQNNVKFFVDIQRDVTIEMEIDRAKSEFVSLASHQLRTPLSTINWYAEMLLNGDVGHLKAGQKQYLEEIYRGNQRMVALVNALLNVSRIELGTFSVAPISVNVAEIVEDAVDEILPDIKKKKLTITKKIPKKIPTIQADPQLLLIVFQNLISNAVKYTPDKGEVVVKISIKKKEGSMNVIVSDNGYGIPKRQQDKIFTKLFRADNVKEKDTEGTGLGLYIVKSIVEHSGGSIHFDSEEEKGTTFYVTLPLSGMKKKEGARRLGK